MTELDQTPVLLTKVDIRQAGLRNKMLLGDVDGDGRMELVMVQPDGGIDDRYVPHQVQCVTAYNLDGRLLWQVGEPDEQAGGPGSDYPAQLYDIDGDGMLEVLCVMHKRFLILDGRTGRTKRSFPLPASEAHDCIIIANLRGLAYPQDIILKDRYRKLWALDRDFRLLWTHEGNIGHYPWVYDIDGDGCDEVMAGYDMLDHTGKLLWSCHNLDDHADCIWVGDVDENASNGKEIVIGGSVTVMYNGAGEELWRYEGSVESQHIALGKFRPDLPGLQVAGLDRIVRGDMDDESMAADDAVAGRADRARADGADRQDGSEHTRLHRRKGKDAIFLLDSCGRELWKEDRRTDGWLTIIETLRHWSEGAPDYILAYRRGGGVKPTLYDGYMRAVVEFPVDGYVQHADLLGSGTEQVVIYDDQTAWIFGSASLDVAQANGKPLPQPKRLYSSTLYPGGEYT